MDVASWLRSLSLGQYEATFREAEIDANILPELTDQDLEKLGVPLRPLEKRLLKAIANCALTEQPPATAAAHARAGTISPSAAKSR